MKWREYVTNNSISSGYQAINLITREAAQLYCQWLNEQIKLSYPKIKFNPIRLPQRTEIQYAYQFWKKASQDHLIDFANYSLNDSLTTYGKSSNKSYTISRVGYFKNYSPTDEIYDLQGNVAEMCYDGTSPGTIGGGWMDSKEELDLFGPDKYKGISIFVVDRTAKGVSATKLDKLGWRASDTGEIAFDNVEIPASNLMGEEGKGFPYIMQHFALERLLMAVNAHGRAEYALEYALQYMSERSTFGKTIDKYQALRHNYAELYADMDVCKSYNYSVAYRLNKGEYVVKEATIAKLKSTKMADDVAYDCLQFLGGYGYMEDYPMARLLRDSRLGPIGGGTSQILKEIIAKMVIDKKEYKKAT